jgi:hypothetical protein
MPKDTFFDTEAMPATSTIGSIDPAPAAVSNAARASFSYKQSTSWSQKQRVDHLHDVSTNLRRHLQRICKKSCPYPQAWLAVGSILTYLWRAADHPAFWNSVSNSLGSRLELAYFHCPTPMCAPVIPISKKLIWICFLGAILAVERLKSFPQDLTGLIRENEIERNVWTAWRQEMWNSLPNFLIKSVSW